MSSTPDQDLMRLLHGELAEAEARALRARIFRDPELAALYRRLEVTWQSLELPPAAPVPLGFAGRVTAKARSNAQRLTWTNAPAWVRAVAAVALVVGALLGAGVGRLLPATGSASPRETDELFSMESTFADAYWQVVSEPASEAAQ